MTTKFIKPDELAKATEYKNHLESLLFGLASELRISKQVSPDGFCEIDCGYFTGRLGRIRQLTHEIQTILE